MNHPQEQRDCTAAPVIIIIIIITIIIIIIIIKGIEAQMRE